jgi:uncharacterized membrane protein
MVSADTVDCRLPNGNVGGSRLECRTQPPDDRLPTSSERVAWKVAGMIGLVALLIYLSVECYQFFDAIESKQGVLERHLGTFALTVFWTLAASMFALLALFARSMTLRIVSMVLLGLATGKVLLLDLFLRPAYTVPFWNPYSFPMVMLAVMILVLSYLWVQRLAEDSIERKIYRFFIFFGVAFLWLTMSVECFQVVRLLAGAEEEAWRAQMALSILWSLFAGVLIWIGFVWRSTILRWMAIILFAGTLLKILIVDMSGVNELYRFGAVFALASLLALAAWAYQRFKPER